ncbi:lipopolysaccharide biosynthesis protein, partial [Fusobacterium polymorphum]
MNALIGLITVPIITRMLSPEQYGVSSLINVITEIMVVVCCLGMDQGFVRFFYEEKEENRGALLYNSLYYCFFITPISFIIIFLLKKRISIFILGKEDGLIWILIILSILFGVLKLFSFLVIRMQQRGKVYSLLNVLIKILEFLFIIFF